MLLVVAVVAGLVASVAVWKAGARRAPAVSRGTELPRLSPFERAKVEWLIANRLPCRGCHAVNGSGGRLGPDLTDVGKD